jgi:hypothetical protein
MRGGVNAPGSVHLAPARRALSAEGRVGLTLDAAAVLVALFVVDRPSTALALLVLNAAVSSAISIGTWRRSLRRVVTPVPDRAVLLPARWATGRLVGSALVTATTLALAVAGVVPPAVLGAGVGAKVGLLWSARKIAQFERQDRCRVLRVLRRRPGQPALYALPLLSHPLVVDDHRPRVPVATHMFGSATGATSAKN